MSSRAARQRTLNQSGISARENDPSNLSPLSLHARKKPRGHPYAPKGTQYPPPPPPPQGFGLGLEFYRPVRPWTLGNTDLVENRHAPKATPQTATNDRSRCAMIFSSPLEGPNQPTSSLVLICLHDSALGRV